jgi:uncharacterized protein GlcG (DUF336 family)
MKRLVLTAACAVVAASCGGGGAGSQSTGSSATANSGPIVASCDGSCADVPTNLSSADVEAVIARGVAEAQARGVKATIAVVDRVGNVLAVFRMSGAIDNVTLRTSEASAPTASGGLENIEIIPATLAAVAKAITGAYLSSEGNAFSTRTASQIIQSHFNPGELLTPGGPLFGVQFSQLPCSDVSVRFSEGEAETGPKRSPLGLAGDPGGFPLYRAGTPVGGVGVVVDPIYGLDRNVLDLDTDIDEAVALAAVGPLAAPDDRRADRITADGKTLRFSDIRSDELRSRSDSPPLLASLIPAVGQLVAVPGYNDALVRAGTAFGQGRSGIRADRQDYAGLDAFVLVDALGNERYRPRAGTEASGALAADEVRAILSSTLRIAQRSRAQIRRPLNSPARVSITVVDSQGEILGLVRTRDAPVFGIDVSVQKARGAALLSSRSAAARLDALPPAVYLDRTLVRLREESPSQYVATLRAFLGLPGALADGSTAFSARAIGNLARPNYPDGVDGNPSGPLSRPAGQWSPLNTGLQLDLVYNAVIQHVAFVRGLASDTPRNCSGVSGFDRGFGVSGAIPGIANGVQIFPGAVPIYRGEQLVGAVGVSGDGVDQDDMIAFLGLARASLAGTALQNAPANRRTDQLAPNGARLRYVNCPQAPFIDSAEQEPCGGL